MNTKGTNAHNASRPNHSPTEPNTFFSGLAILSSYNQPFQSNKTTKVVATASSLRKVAAFGVAALLVGEGLFALGELVGHSLAMGATGADVGLFDKSSKVGPEEDWPVSADAISTHSFVPSLLSGDDRQYPSHPSQLFAHFAVRQVASVSPSHSSNGSILDAA